MSNTIIGVIGVGDSLTFSGGYHFWTACGGTAAANLASESDVQRKGLRVHPVAQEIWASYALSGWRLTELITDAPNVAALMNPTYQPVAGRSARKYILLCLVGTNPSDNNPTTFAASVRSYLLARKAEGFYPLIGTLPDRGDGVIANFATSYQQPYNAIVRTWGESDGVYGVIDYAADAIVGDDGASMNATNFDSFHIHPIGPAVTLMANRTWTAVRTLAGTLRGLAVPTGVNASAAGGGAKVILSGWPPEDEITQWRIYRNTSNNFFTSTRIATVTVDNTPPLHPSYFYEDIGLEVGTPLYYWITRYDGSTHESGPSTVVSATPTA